MLGCGGAACGVRRAACGDELAAPTSVPHMADLLEHLVRWNLHPERIVTARFPLAEAGQAYATADAGQGGKVAIVMDR